MKRLYIFFFFVATLVQSQDFSNVDAKVDLYPRYRSPEQLAARIQKDFQSDINKTRAAFKWLTNNIRYSLQLANSRNRVIQYKYADEQERLLKLQQIKDKIVNDAFISRVGVCEEYAQSLKKLCDLMGIESEVIKGNVRNSGNDIGRFVNGTNHAWNIVKIDSKWIFIDPTWAAGYSMNGRWTKNYTDYYFNVPYSKIGKTHFPDSRKWQIIWDVRSKEQYYLQPIYNEAFLRRNLSYPKNVNGVLKVKKGENVSLKINGLTLNEKIFIGYGNEKYSKKPVLSKRNSGFEISVPAPLSDTELYLFINGQLATIFKVRLN